MIYDKILVDITSDLLSEHSTIPETDFKRMVETYFNWAKEKKSQDESRQISSMVCQAKFLDLGTTFKLIEEKFAFPLFIPQNTEAISLLESYKQLAETRKSNWQQARNEYAKIKSQMAMYIINVSAQKIASAYHDLEEETWFWILPPEQINNYYDPKIGFNITLMKEEDLIW